MNNNISGFLEKFRSIFKDNNDLKNNIIKSIQIETNLKIDFNNINIKNNRIFINDKPYKKNEIFMKKDKIINHINKNQNNINIIDIK